MPCLRHAPPERTTGSMTPTDSAYTTAGRPMSNVAPDHVPEHGSRSGHPRIFAVASGKGGVGKTWLAVTLTHALAGSGRRALLFDGDLGLANVDVQLGLLPQQDLGSVLNGRATLRQAVMRYDRGGFDILPGMSGSGGLAALPPSRLVELGRDLRGFASAYDVTVIDLGAGLDRTVRRLSQLADCCLVVTTGEPTALTDAYAFIKLTALERPGAPFRIIVNMAASAADGQRTYDTLLRACRSFLRIEPPLAGIVRRDRRVADAIRSQTPLLTRFPGSEAAADVETIAGRLLSAG